MFQNDRNSVDIACANDVIKNHKIKHRSNKSQTNILQLIIPWKMLDWFMMGECNEEFIHEWFPLLH